MTHLEAQQNKITFFFCCWKKKEEKKGEKIKEIKKELAGERQILSEKP